MKFLKYITFVLMPCFVMSTFLFTSCDDGDGMTIESPNGNPVIQYIRVTNPDASDSLLVSAQLGSTIAIMGENLGGIREVWFNDRKASISPTWVTNRSIIVTIPQQAPVEMTDIMLLIDADGDTLKHDFIVTIPPPLFESMKCEYVEPGGEATLIGNYYFEPLTITFPGGLEAEVIEITQTEARVIVPDGAVPGRIIMETLYGIDSSDYWYHDNRNVFMSYDSAYSYGWYGDSHRFITEVDPDVPNISGNFVRIDEDLEADPYFEWTAPENHQDDPIAAETANIPGDAFENPFNYVLKFELLTFESLSGAYFRWYIGNEMSPRNDENYLWEPDIDTEKEWETVSIPFEDIISNSSVVPDEQYGEVGYDISFWIWQSPQKMTVSFAVDNLRVVPIELD